MKTWTKSEWHVYWGKRNKWLRDFLWDVMVSEHKRMKKEGLLCEKRKTTKSKRQRKAT